MINLPFNQWTLLFQNEEYERKYEIENNQNRLLHYRVFGIFTMFLCAIYLIIYALAKQSIFIVLSMGALLIMTGVGIFNLKRFVSHIRMIQTATYLTSIAVSLYMATVFENKNALYIYGFSCSSITSVMFLYSHYKFRLVMTLVVPASQLYIMEIYTAQNLQFIILLFSTQIVLAIYAHYSEYMLRVAFSYKILNEKFKNIIQQFMPQSLFAISLNTRTNQFELQYQNQQSQKQFKVEDTKSMIETLRNIFVSPKSQNASNTLIQNTQIQKSVDLQFKKVGTKKQTLEEYAYHKIKEQKTPKPQNIDELDAIYYVPESKNIIQLSIELQNIQYGQNVLIIVIKEELVGQVAMKDIEQQKFLKKILKFISIQLYASQQKFFLAIQQITSQDYADTIQNIKCLNLFVMNQFQNFFVYLNSQQINKELQNISTVLIHQFIKNFQVYFSQAAANQNRKFNLYFDVADMLIKINTKSLSQIVINVFETALENSNINSEISLTITRERNLNPLQSEEFESTIKRSQNPTQRKLDDSYESQILQDKQQLIKFSFSFKTYQFVELEPNQKFFLNPITLEEFVQNNQQEFNIPYFITNFLLEKIGPYNKIQITQTRYTNPNLNQQSDTSNLDFILDEDEVYLNFLTFYIYTDQSQLTKSFLKCIRQRSFLKE